MGRKNCFRIALAYNMHVVSVRLDIVRSDKVLTLYLSLTKLETITQYTDYSYFNKKKSVLLFVGNWTGQLRPDG